MDEEAMHVLGQNHISWWDQLWQRRLVSKSRLKQTESNTWGREEEGGVKGERSGEEGEALCKPSSHNMCELSTIAQIQFRREAISSPQDTARQLHLIFAFWPLYIYCCSLQFWLLQSTGDYFYIWKKKCKKLAISRKQMQPHSLIECHLVNRTVTEHRD